MDMKDEPSPEEVEFDAEAFAKNFAWCSWQAMKDFDQADPEGYLKLSEVSRKLRYDTIDQMIDATHAPHAVAVTTFAVEFMTMIVAKIVDTAKDAPEEMSRKAGMFNISDEQLFDTFAQGLMVMCKALYKAGNTPVEAKDEKIIAFVS